MNEAIIANMRKAARDRETVTIGGGVFTPTELLVAALAIEHVNLMLSVLVRAKDAIEALDGTSVEHEKLVDDYRAAIAEVTGVPA
jgi:hypothetical protein